MELKIDKLNKNNLGLGFSCTKENGLWGSKFHQKSVDFILNNFDYKFYVYGVTIDNISAGHVIILDAKGPFSPIESKEGVFLKCIYLLEQHRKKGIGILILKEIEENMKELGKKVIFTHSVGNSEWMNKEFFIRNGFKEVPSGDELIKILYKPFETEINYKINDISLQNNITRTNTIFIKYNPLCPLENAKYAKFKELVNKNFEEIEIEEDYGFVNGTNSGVYFNNIPILFNENKEKETLEIIKSLILEI